MTTITALPTPPSRDDPANFATEADAFLGALPTFVTETNAVAGEVNAAKVAAELAETNAGSARDLASGYATTALGHANTASGYKDAAAASALTAVNAPGTSATSTTSLTVGLGSQSLTIQTGKAFVVGMTVKIAKTADPTVWMHGDITSHDSGTGALVVNSTLINGSGTASAWTVSLSAPSGQVNASNDIFNFSQGAI